MCYVNLHILETVIISRTPFPHIVVSDTNNTEIFYSSRVGAGKKEMLDEFAITPLIYNFYKNLMTNFLRAGQPRDDYDLNKLIIRSKNKTTKMYFLDILEIFDKISQILD